MCTDLDDFSDCYLYTAIEIYFSWGGEAVFFWRAGEGSGGGRGPGKLLAVVSLLPSEFFALPKIILH